MKNFLKKLALYDSAKFIGKELKSKQIKVASLGDQWKVTVDKQRVGGMVPENLKGQLLRLRMAQLNPQKERLDAKNPNLFNWLVNEAKSYLALTKVEKPESTPAAAEAETAKAKTDQQPIDPREVDGVVDVLANNPRRLRLPMESPPTGPACTFVMDIGRDTKRDPGKVRQFLLLVGQNIPNIYDMCKEQDQGKSQRILDLVKDLASQVFG